MEELQRMIELVSGEDPQLRRYAITQIEYLAESADAEIVMDALRNAIRDPVPFVSHQANRTLAAILSRGMRGHGPNLRMDGTPSEAKSASAADQSSPELASLIFEDVPIDALRKTGTRVLWPLIEKLKRLCENPDPALAKRSIIALGKSAESSAGELIATTLFDPELAAASAIALPRIAPQASLGALIRAATAPDSRIRQYAILELANRSEAEALDAILANLKHIDPSLRANVALALGRFPDPDRVVVPLIELIQDEQVFVVLDAIHGLGRTRNAGAARALVERYLKCEDNHIKAATLVSFGGIRSNETLAIVKQGLREKDDRVRANAVEAFQELVESPEARVEALSGLLTDSNNRVRANAALAINCASPGRAMEVLSSMVTSDDVWSRASGAYALGVLASPQSLDCLIKLLAVESETEVLIPAMKALDSLEKPPVVQPVLKLLDHPAPAIRTRAARLLGRSGDPKLFRPMREKFEKENDPSVRATLIAVLGMVADNAGLIYITNTLERDTQSRVQANAIEVLSRRGGLAHLCSIRAHVISADNRVKANSVIALFQNGEFQVVTSLADMLSDPSPRQVYSAIFAIGEIGRSLADLHPSHSSLTLLHSLKNRYMLTSAMSSRPVSSIQEEDPEDSSREDETILKAIYLKLEGDSSEAQMQMHHLDAAMPGSAIPDLITFRTGKAASSGPAYREILDRIVDEMPGYVDPALELANILSQEKDTAGMVESYLRVYERRIRLLEEQLDLLRTLLEGNRRSEAVFVLKDVMSSVPLRAGSHHRLGKIYLSLKRFGPALKQLRLAHLSAPTDPEVAYDYACACYAEGRLRMALMLCHIAVRHGDSALPTREKARKMHKALRDRVKERKESP